MHHAQALAAGAQVLQAPRSLRPRSRSCAPRTQALFGRRNTEADAEKEEQYRVQQELLQRRKTGAWQKDVTERRKEVSRYLNDKDYKKQVDAEKRKRFLAAEKEAREAEPKGFAIIIPVNPMGMPMYDGGERFDLRGKYVDEGWVDEDADVLGKIGRWFKGGNKGEVKEDEK